MEAVLVYQEYFLKKKKNIESLLGHFKQMGEKVAVWGAGQRGLAFLQVYDPQQNYIAYVYDIDEKRYGDSLITGHKIVSYKECYADVVLVMNCLYEMDIRETLQREGINTAIINIDTLILGDLQLEDVITPGGLDLQPVRNIKMAALTILYHPTDKTIQNLNSYAAQFEKIYIYDNTETPTSDIQDKLLLLKNAVYISEGENKGLSKVINQICRLAVKEGFDWLITFDQDSRPLDGMVPQMAAFANSAMCSDSIGLIAPNILGKEIVHYDIYCTYFDKVFQSGAMHSLKAWDMVGGYDEKLFIDQVDYEYCVRMRLSGYKIIKINNAYMEHNLDDDEVEIQWQEGHKVYINKYSPMRYYHILKNNLYLYDKYQSRDKIYALECENNIKNIRKNAKYDNHREENEKALRQAETDYREQQI